MAVLALANGLQWRATVEVGGEGRWHVESDHLNSYIPEVPMACCAALSEHE